MTDGERKKLCAELRNPYERDFATFDKAADEIDRLAEERNSWVRDGEIAWRKVLELQRAERERQEIFG